MKVIPFHRSERQLIKRALRNSRKAQQTLYEIHAPKMLSVCRYYIKDVHHAEEVMCNGFFKVFTKLKSFKEEGSFEGWIRRIMVRECLTHLRQHKTLYFSDDGILEGGEVINSLDSELAVAHIQSMIDELPEGYRTVFVMYAVEGYKHQEIAKMLEISESTSKTQLFKARKALQTALLNEKLTNYGTN